MSNRDLLNGLLSGVRSRVAAAERSGMLSPGESGDVWIERAESHLKRLKAASSREERAESYEMMAACAYAAIKASGGATPSTPGDDEGEDSPE